MFGKGKPKLPTYAEMADTPYITQARDLENIGYQGVKDNINKVNVFDDATKRSLQNVIDNYSNYANDQLNQSYKKQVADLNNQNYGRFGTTNATGALYSSDMLGQQFNKLASANAYNASNMYQDLINDELINRYKTLNTYKNLYDTEGDKAYKQDLMNYNTRLQNQTIGYKNAVADYNAKAGAIKNITNAVGSALQFVPGWGTAIGTAIKYGGQIVGGSDAQDLSGSGYQVPGYSSADQSNITTPNVYNSSADDNLFNVFTDYSRKKYDTSNQSNETGSLWGNNGVLRNLIQNYQSPYGRFGLNTTNLGK